MILKSIVDIYKMDLQDKHNITTTFYLINSFPFDVNVDLRINPIQEGAWG